MPDTAEVAADFLDANVLQTAGFSSVLMVPLMTKGRAVGTLNLVARQADRKERAIAYRDAGDRRAVAGM